MEACKCLPQDDEKVTAFLGAALEAYWFSNKPLKDVLFLIFWMQDTVVKMTQIWEHSPISVPRDARLLHAVYFVANSREAISAGRATDDSVVKPLNVVSCLFPMSLIVIDFTLTRNNKINGQLLM
jgi:hypothetical protein